MYYVFDDGAICIENVMADGTSTLHEGEKKADYYSLSALEVKYSSSESAVQWICDDDLLKPEDYCLCISYKEERRYYTLNEARTCIHKLFGTEPVESLVQVNTNMLSNPAECIQLSEFYRSSDSNEAINKNIWYLNNKGNLVGYKDSFSSFYMNGEMEVFITNLYYVSKKTFSFNDAGQLLK